MAGLIAATEVSVLNTANNIWVDTTPSTSVEAITTAPQFIVTDSIILNVATEAVGAGVLDLYCSWFPLSPDSQLVAA